MKRVNLDGRVFLVKVTPTGHTAIYERKVYAPGKPYEAFYNAPLFHSGQGRKPGKIAKRVLDTGVLSG